jgi:predicted Zn-dependent protease
MRVRVLAFAIAFAAFAQSVASADEASLMAQAALEEREIQQSAFVERAAPLNAYAREVLCRVAPDECRRIRLYIVRSPDFGARTLPNGAIEIGVGLLWRCVNEAQLAFVLSRQAAHLTEGHALGAMKTADRLDDARLMLDASAALAGAYYTFGFIDLGLNGVAELRTRSREREADRLALERMIAAGYDNADAFALSNAMAGEARASRRYRPRSERDAADLDRAAPTTRGRLRALMAHAAPSSSSAADARVHRERIRPHLASWLEADLQRRDYEASLFAFSRLAASGVDLGVVHYYRGEAFRLRRGEGDLARAAEEYRRAVRHPDAPPGAWRELGEAEVRAGNVRAAQDALRQYLELATYEQDRALIEALLDELREQ